MTKKRFPPMLVPMLAPILVLAALAAPAPAVAPPVAGAATLEQLARPLPLPYDEAADADAAVATAQATARRTGRKLLIDLGGNWCLDCRVLAGVVALPAVRAFVEGHYVLVTVDIGRMDKNRQIPARYGIASLEGVPALLVVDPASGKLLNRGHLFALADARSMTPQALADWLAQWV